jgi:hypothetical protein
MSLSHRKLKIEVQFVSELYNNSTPPPPSHQ